ncbi:MAG: hypothetical protein C4533_05960 [Candidatus Omnitrophota bacterium]|jgi:hypothetical protein|nr:MAG: hypothetical protein C4533_05960 [Candidatus Omnitrophota bacterium]
MAKKEFSKENLDIKKEGKRGFEASEKNAYKVTGLSSKAFSVIKFIFGLCLLPFVYGVTVSFLGEFSVIDISAQNHFWYGLISLLIVYLFIWEPAIVYASGHKLLEIMFSFIRPLVRVAPYLIPVYSLVIFLCYLAVSLIFRHTVLINYFMFLFGLSIGLHLIFGAKSLRTKKEDLLKSNYIFGFSFVYITNIILVAFCLNIIFDRFSFVNFCNNAFQSGGEFFYGIFRQLFLAN